MQGFDQVNDIRVPFAIDHLFLQIDNHCSRRLQNAMQLFGDWHEPINVLVRRDAAIR
jgi:hypothetical protein